MTRWCSPTCAGLQQTLFRKGQHPSRLSALGITIFFTHFKLPSARPAAELQLEVVSFRLTDWQMDRVPVAVLGHQVCALMTSAKEALQQACIARGEAAEAKAAVALVRGEAAEAKAAAAAARDEAAATGAAATAMGEALSNAKTTSDEHSAALTTLLAASAALESGRRALRLRAASAALEELAIIKETGLSQPQLRETRYFSIESIRSMQSLPRRAAMRVMSSASATSIIVEQTARDAILAGLGTAATEEVVAEAARLAAAGSSAAEVERASHELINIISALTALGGARDATACRALMAVDVSALTATYETLIAPQTKTAVAAGRKETSLRGDSVAHLDHAALAAANLEDDAKQLFGNSTHLCNVLAMVAAFRSAYAAVLAGGTEVGGAGGAAAMPSSGAAAMLSPL